MEFPPETRYARTEDGLAIAYQTLGEGPADVVFVPAGHSVDAMWEEPSYAHFLQRLARLGRLICLDYRGFGGSDPVPLGALPVPETWMEDTRVVLDAVGSTTAHIISHGVSGFFGVLFAATYPERTSTLTLVETTARLLRADDYPPGVDVELFEQFVELVASVWGSGDIAALWAPSRRDDALFRRWHARYERASSPGPSAVSALLRFWVQIDLRAVLPTVRVPTLVVHREADQLLTLEHGRYLADHIPGATLSVVPGTDYWFFTEHADAIVDRIEEFITGVPSESEPDRALATVLFTDIVSSTEHAARLGDRRWTELLDRHDTLVAKMLDRYQGRAVNPTGDGVLATFDGPARAVRCARAICESVQSLGIEVRAGLHTGEVELRGENIRGLAVHIGQRVSALAGPGEVLVSRTVTDLVVGSGLRFEPRGDHELKGVPGTWALFSLQAEH